ncbi:cytochrome ubiquinol oxidase subunit I [Oscillospiraceae bacterium CM]|nr:cytochrome ubiquinol oxidase subunit I [Oscillospiraceae bacterium CM]
MDVIVLSRIQFLLTTVFHYFFVPITIGLSIIVAIFQTVGYVKKDEAYTKLSIFFGKLFIVNFAVGVVTGIIQEFQFGMNWAGYSRFVGDIFGAPLAIEALAAFFLESTFIGVWLLGRNKLSPKVHNLSIWLVALGSTLSAYWILVANSFMQHPTGYSLNGGRAEMTDFAAVIFNQHALLQFAHVVVTALLTAAFFVMGISAYRLLRKKNADIFAKSFKFSVIVGLIFVIASAFTGDLQGKFLVKEQPMKIAAAEALWDTAQPAPFAVIAGIDEANQKNTFEIAIPNLLSFLSYNNFTGEVKGIKDLQNEMSAELGDGNYIPPVAATFWSFRLMIGFAGLMLVLCILALAKWKNNRFTDSKFLLGASLAAISFPYIANTSGWMMAELGRQPFIVYKLLTLDNAVSTTVAPGWVIFSSVGFVLIFVIAAVADVVLIKRIAKEEIKEEARK